jgi:hypothetical protein
MASWRQQQEQEEREQRELLVQKLERNLQPNLNVWREILEKRDDDRASAGVGEVEERCAEGEGFGHMVLPQQKAG